MDSSENRAQARKARVSCLVCALLLIAAKGLTTLADEQDAKFAALPRGTSVIAPGAIEKNRVQGEFGRAEPVVIEDRTSAEAVRVRTDKRPAQSYRFQLRVPTAAAVKKGEKLLAVFDARALEPQARDGIGETEFAFEQRDEPYTRSVSHHVEFGTRWQRFYIPFEAKLDHEPGEAAVIFRAGFDPQTIEIGGVQVRSFGLDFPLEKLPATPTGYIGRDPGAPWRRIAAERIERLRKAGLTVTVTDAAGRPLPGVNVRAQMIRSAFGWGSAVDARTLLGGGPDSERYRRIILENFNKVVLENDLKWHAWMTDRQRALDAVRWLRERGLSVRGHVLVWPGKQNLPKQVVELLNHPGALRSAILDHITDEAGALRGQLVEWDVVNEPYTNFDVQTALTGVTRDAAPDAVERHAAALVPFFKAAREADPGVKLDINDYSILETGGKDAAHQEHYERTIRALLAAGAPLQGIGIQGHFADDLTPIPRLWEILDRFGKFKLPIQITEFDVNVSDEALQADYTRDFLTAMFAHESVIGVLIWGFWEKRHWIPNAAHYRADWSLRPAGQAWLDLVRKQWRTDAEGITDARGQWKARAFDGDYEITASSNEKTATVTATRAGSGADVKVVLR